MNKEEFESKFNAGTAKTWLWANDHRKATLAIACFVIGWCLGKFL